MPNNIEKLYQNLKADGYQLGTIDEFTRNMSDSTKADKLYQNLSADGYQLGSREDFFGKIRPQQQPQQAPAQTVAQPQSTPQPMYASVSQPQQPATPFQMPQGFGQLDMNANQFGKQSWEQPAQEPKKETVVEKQQRMLDGKATKQEEKQVQNAMQQRKDEIEYEQETGKRLRQPVLNTEFEAPTVERDENGNLLVGNTTDQAKVGAHQQVKREQESFFDINKELSEAYQERNRIEALLKKDKEGERALRDVIMSGGYDPTPNDNLHEREAYNSALRLIDRRIKALETARDNGGFWGGTGDVLSDPSTYSFGLTDFADSKALHSIYEKVEKAKAEGTMPQLTEAEKVLAQNYILNQQAQALNMANDWYQMGQSFGQSLSFMKDFLITGGGFMNIAKAGMQAGEKLGTRIATKALGDYMTKNLGTKTLGKVIQYTGKGTGLIAGAETGGLLLNNTAQAASTMADTMNEQMGRLTTDKDGNYTFEGSKSLAEAVLKTQLRRGGENASELVGLAFDAVPGFLAKVIQKTKVGNLAKKIAGTKAWKGYEKGMNYLGVQSLWGEGMEEEAGMLRTEFLNTITNGEFEPNAESITDLDNQLKTWEQVAITSMLLRVPSMIATGVQGANYYGNQYNLNTSDRQMHDVLGDDGKYEAVKSALDGADNKNLPSVLNNVINNGGLNKEEKQAVFMYANDLVKLRGFNIANVVAAANGITEQPRVASYQVKADGKSFDELDENGNVIEHHEFENNDEMRTALYEAQQKRFDSDLQSDIAAMQARPNDQYGALLREFCNDNEIDPNEMTEALNKPNMERTDAEQQMVLTFAKLLHNTVYDSSMLHEEQSAQDGANLADEMGIDLDNLSPEQVQQVQEVTAAWNGAKNSREQLFARNEEIAQEVISREQQGLSPQEVVASLDTFNEVDRQIVIDYYNQKARFDGLIYRLNDKINEAAANERQRHTFKGTINGQADLSNVHTITDGTNKYYLVSGNVTTDSQGKITGSDSGLVIGMDLDGSFVQIKDTDGYSVLPVEETLDQLEEAERIRLQEQTTGVIDPNGLMNPQTEQPQPMNSGEQAGAQAGASTGTGANEAPAAPLSSEPQQPQVTIESVADKDGIKRYENGIAVDDAIADIQSDGFDVNEVADASIAEAQQTIDKIDKKPAKTRKDLVDKKGAQDVITYYNNVKARWAEMNAEAQPAESEENVNIQPEQPVIEEKTVSSQQSLTVEEQKQQRIAEAKAKYGELFDDDFTKANDVYELVSMWVGRKRNLAWDDVNGKRGLQKELGWTRKIGGDTKYIETLLAKKGEGMGVDEFVHMIWESPENDIMGEKRFSTEEIKEALLNLLKSARSKSDVVDYALNTRINAAEAAMLEQQKREEEEAEQQEEIEPLTAEQIAEMESNLPFAQSTDEDIPDSPIVQLEKVVAELQQQEGMPPIKLVDTDRMSDDEWYDIASVMYEGAFVAQEEIDFVRNTVLKDGLYIVEESGAITVYSDSQTAEELKYKFEYIKEQNNGRSNEEETGGLETQDVQRPEKGVHGVQSQETPAAEGGNGSEGQGSTESAVDDYLQPRNAEEESIVQNTINQLQQEIQSAIEEQNKARSELEKAMARESERATDMFGNDNALNQPGQLFDNSDMPIDQSVEGVERRTAAEREKLQEATNKLNQLQSLQERNSRVRGALDNYRRQTKIETEEQPTAYQPKWQYQFHYDKETGRAWITRDDVSGPIPVGDGRFRIEGNSLAELRAILENPKNNLGELLKEVEAQLHNAEVGEQIRNASTPTEAIEQAAQQFQQEQKEKAYGADNKLVSQDRYEELKKRMKQKLLGQANMGFDPEIMQIGAEMAMFHIEAGARKFADYATRMINDLGDAIRPYLQGFYEAARRMPGMEQLRKEMDSTEFVDNFDVLSYDKQNDNSVNVNKTENNESENSASLQQEAAKPAEELEGDSAEFAERQKKITDFRMSVHEALRNAVFGGEHQLKTMQNVRALANELGLTDMSITDLQELVEAEIVSIARKIAENERWTDEQKFVYIRDLYNFQPTLGARDNDRINKQQYSTPAPMAFLMGKFVDPQKKAKSGLEPSAGNGMLTINLPKEIMHVNDIDEMRLSNLQKQGFGEVTSQDGTKSFGKKKYDVIVTNPPFGSVLPKEWGVYEISSLEQQMALNALDAMKDDGRAAIIIGGNTEYKRNGAVQGKDRQFLNYLYQAYNVVDVINMDGKALYTKQGTGYPVRMILINGRKPKYDATVYAPVRDKARAEQVKTYEELYKRVNDDILSNTNKPAGVHDTASGESNRRNDSGHAETSSGTGVRNVRTEGSTGEHPVLASGGRSVSGSNNTTKRTDGKEQPSVGGGLFDVGSGTEPTQSSGGTSSQTESGERGGRLASGRVDAERQTGEPNVPIGVGQRRAESSQSVQQPEQQRGLSTEKVPYKKQSGNPFTLQSLMPAEQADEVKKILEELGDVDQFLVDELGYSSKEELHKALAAEQIDSVAMAIHQMNQGNAFIIGDMTGIGKGRQAAALIRYGVKKGGFPVFITVKKGLFSDMYRDLCDIGSPDLKPFIWCADDEDHSQNVTDSDDNVVYKWDKKEQERVTNYINKNGKLPPEYDYIVTTYDGFKSGTMDYEGGQKKAAKAKEKGFGTTALNGQKRRDALEVLCRNSYIIMDESHNAGGKDSNISKFLQYITAITKGTTFLSATFAKRPDNMPIYALRTAISKAGVKIDELIDAVRRGGATFQEIMSKALTGAGQMIRRERDMTGVTIDWRGIEDEAIVQQQREQYDKVIGLFNEIIDFQRTYVDPIVNQMNDEAAEMQGEVDHTPGTRDMGINNTPFASRTYNIVQQVLLSLKAEETAKRAIEYLKQGKKPVIAVANTNEKASEEASKKKADSEEEMLMPDLSVNLLKGLEGTLRIQKKDANNKKTQSVIPFDRLSPEAQKRYHEIEQDIENASTGLSLSPIDVIKNEIKKAGYSVGELTGRKAEFIYNEDGTVKRVSREDTKKKVIANRFNRGDLDCLILNRSAGTGISLHASTKFKDQRQRVMIVAQAQGDVNDEVQIRGRIDRTGQVQRGMYEYVVSQIPSEQRLLMMLKAKLRSLDANTTSSQKSKFNEMQVQDIMNKYGDAILIQYLAENPDTYAKLADPLKWGDSVYDTPVETLITNARKVEEDGGTASKILGRMALLKVKEQEKMLADISALYQNEIDRLNEMGENDLEITEMPLKAKTLSKQVWEQGIDPDSNNPFADNTYVEKVNMDVLRKPMKASEVKASQERLLGGKTWEEYKQETLAKVDEWAEKKKAETTATITERAKKKAEAEQERYIKGAKKAQEKTGMSDEEIEKNGQFQYDNIYKEEMKKLDDALASIEAQKQVFVDALETFSTDGVYALPQNIYDLGSMTFEPGFGKLIDIKISDNMSPNASTISFATLDGRRKITIPINGKVKQQKGEKVQIFPTINSLTAQTRSGWFGQNTANTLKVLEQNIDNWDKLTSTAARKDGYIITGNLLKALVSTREQGVGGKLISFTTDTGEVRQGILMPDNFEPKGLTSKTPISAKKDELKYNRDKVESADGDVVIRVTGRWDWTNHSYNTLEITVPKSTKKGAKYYNDETLLSLMDGQFEGSSKMKAEFKRENLDAVMKRLDELGVTVAEEHKEEDSPKRMITTSNPLEAINQAAESWRQTSQKPATNSKLQEISDMVNSLANRDELKGKAPTYIINSRQDLEALDGQFNSRVYREIERLYADTDTGAAYIPRAGIVVIFGEHLEDAKEAEAAWWHEQTHGFWQKTPENVRRKFGEDCLMWLKKNRSDLYNHITKPGNYPVYDWLNEACAFFIGNVAIETYGTERFLTGNFVGNPEICNFANELLNHIKNGRTKQTNSGANQLRRVGEGEQASATQIRGSNQQGRERGDNVLRSEEESELQEVVDPIKAIELSAKRWKRERNDAIAGEDTPEKHSAKAVYNNRLNSVETVFTEAHQDAMVSLKTAQNAIAGDKEIPDSQNAYMAENLMHGKNKNEMDLYNKELRDPLIKTINKIMNLTGMNWGDVDRYVYSKSGLERNREFFVRDWLENASAKAETADEKEHVRNIEDSWNGLKDRTYQELKADLITYAEYLDELAQFIRREIDGGYKPEEHDYSGFRAMYGDEEGKYEEADIIDELMNDEDMMEAENVDTLWNQINAATRYGLERYREAGMRSDEDIDRVEQMFHFYVPMRGFKENMGEDMYQYFTGKDKAKSYVGGLLKHAKGRGSEAQFPISTIFAMSYKAISDCNQNLVNQKFYRLCQANPNDLVVLSDSWAVYNELTGEWEESTPGIPEDATEDEVREITLAWEEQMQQLALENKAKKIKGKAEFDYKPMDKKKQSEHIVDVRINGQPKKMIVTGNPRMAQALNGQLRFETKYFGKWYTAIKNFMASMFTSYSPTFALRNMFRDWTHFRTMLGVREGHGYASQANKYYRQSLFKMVGLFKKYREGTLDESNEMERDFKDFMDNGGITGFVMMQKVDDIQKQMEKLYEDQKAGKVIRLNDNLWMKILHAVEALNEGIENNARFATYRASRHYAGRTKARSAYDAKEITVNFNRKGAGSKTAGFKSQNKKVEDAAKVFGVTSQILGEGRIFFNATVQAIATTFKNFQNADGSLNKPYIAKWAAKYALPPFMFGLLLPAINKALANAFGGDDDDPYANLPEWTRRRNLCFYIGNDNFITIPVGQELAAFLALGDIIAGNTYAPDLKPVDRGVGDEMIDVMNTFSPVDVSTKITKGGLMENPISEVTGRTFSVLAPLVAIDQNLGWTGRPIYREDKFQNDQYTPEYQMVYQSTNPVLTNAMKQLHEWGGGDDITRGKFEVNPAIIQYLWEQYTGGPGKVFSNTISIGKDAKDILTGNESDFNIRKVEGLKAFVSQGDDRTQYYRTQAKYRKYKEDAAKLYDAVKGYEAGAAENPEYLLKLEKLSKGEDFVRMQIIREADKQLNQINKAANKAEGKERKELRQIYNQQMKEVVDMLDEVGTD